MAIGDDPFRLRKLRAIADADGIQISDELLSIVAGSDYSDNSLDAVLHYLASKAAGEGVELTEEFIRYEVIERGAVWKPWSGAADDG